MRNLNKKRIYCSSGQKLSAEIIGQLASANADAKGDYNKYMRAIEEIFCLGDPDPKVTLPKVTTESQFWLGGFIEGEASLNVSAKKLKTAKFGLIVDPEFSITQHVNSVELLYFAMKVFKTGRLRYKSGSNATLVFVINNRQSLEEKVLPFLQKYVIPYGSAVKKKRTESFSKVLTLMKENVHTDLERFVSELLPQWDALRIQKGQLNESFKNLEEAQEYVRSFLKTL